MITQFFGMILFVLCLLLPMGAANAIPYKHGDDVKYTHHQIPMKTQVMLNPILAGSCLQYTAVCEIAYGPAVTRSERSSRLRICDGCLTSQPTF